MLPADSTDELELELLFKDAIDYFSVAFANCLMPVQLPRAAHSNRELLIIPSTGAVEILKPIELTENAWPDSAAFQASCFEAETTNLAYTFLALPFVRKVVIRPCYALVLTGVAGMKQRIKLPLDYRVEFVDGRYLYVFTRKVSQLEPPLSFSIKNLYERLNVAGIGFRIVNSSLSCFQNLMDNGALIRRAVAKSLRQVNDTALDKRIRFAIAQNYFFDINQKLDEGFEVTSVEEQDAFRQFLNMDWMRSEAAKLLGGSHD